MFGRNFFIFGNKSTLNMTKLEMRKKYARNWISQKLIFTKMNVCKVAKVLLCSFLSFSFNLFFLFHSLEKHTKLDWKNWKTPKVLLCSLSIFSFNLLILSHLQERRKLWIENMHKSLCLPSDIKKAEKRQMFYCFHF